jgi:hypothetical protein
MAVAPKTDPAPVNLPPETPATGCEAVRQEITKYNWDHTLVMAIARAENRSCDPVNHNLTATETHRDRNGNVICVGSYGVIQVGCLHYREGEDRNDLATNIKVAHRVYVARASWDSSGYNAWTQYKNGAYKEFLK